MKSNRLWLPEKFAALSSIIVIKCLMSLLLWTFAYRLVNIPYGSVTVVMTIDITSGLILFNHRLKQFVEN